MGISGFCLLANSFLLILLVHSSLMPAFASSDQTQALAVEDSLRIRNLDLRSPIAVSPDGKWLAYTVKSDNKRKSGTGLFSPAGTFVEAIGCDVWVTNLESKTTESLGLGESTNWGPVWSPDGKFLAFYSDRDGFARLWLWETDSHGCRKLSDEIVRPSFNFQTVKWSADSKKIVFKNLPEGMTLDKAPWMKRGDAAPESKKQIEVVLFKSPPRSRLGNKIDTTGSAPRNEKGESSTSASGQSSSEKSQKLDNSAYSSDGIFSADLAIVDVCSLILERVATKSRPASFWISPDGRYLAFLNLLGTRPNTQYSVYQLNLVDLSSHAVKSFDSQIVQDYGDAVSWSPDSSALAYISRNLEGESHAYVVRVSGTGAAEDWTPELASLSEMWSSSSHDAPRWDSDSKAFYVMGFPKNGRANIIWKASAGNCKLLGQIPHVLVRQIAAIDNSQAWIVGQSLVLSTMDEKTKDCGFYKMDVNTGAVEKIIEEKAYFAASPFSINVSKSGKTIAYVRQSPSEPTDVWVASEKLSDHRKVSELNSSMKDVCFGKCRILSFTGKGGKRLNAALLLPGNYKEGQKFPLIVHVYGGMFLSEDVNCFGLSRLNEGVDNWQLYASRGYAVLQPDILINKGTPVDDIVHSIRASIASVLATGMIDSKRIGLIGHSYGAYSTLSLITRSDLFSAAVACSGPADLVSAYGNLDNDSTGWAESGQGNMLGTPWQFRERYIKNSPVFFLDRVQTPLLLVHGEADRTISCKQSEEVFVGLRRLGREVEYARYPGEAHWPGGWGYTNQVDYLNRVIEWFDKHLKADLK